MKFSKPHFLHKQFPLPEGCSIKSFVMREIDGHDEQEAGRWLAARGSSTDNESLALFDELLRVSLVMVNGKKIEQPYSGLNKWSAKTRRYLAKAFEELNGVDEDDLETFTQAATVISDPSAAQVLSEAELAQELANG